jgi:hypothetical protein
MSTVSAEVSDIIMTKASRTFELILRKCGFKLKRYCKVVLGAAVILLLLGSIQINDTGKVLQIIQTCSNSKKDIKTCLIFRGCISLNVNKHIVLLHFVTSVS